MHTRLCQMRKHGCSCRYQHSLSPPVISVSLSPDLRPAEGSRSRVVLHVVKKDIADDKYEDHLVQE